MTALTAEGIHMPLNPAEAFPAYLKNAIDRALDDERENKDNGELKWFLGLCQNGVRQNHENLSATTFLSNYL